MIKMIPVLLLICLCLTGPCTMAQEKADGIIWSANKLTWDDFKEDESDVKYSGILASTHTKLFVSEIDTVEMREKKGISVNVYALMIPSASWVRQSSKNMPSVLAHEQLHFDIVELNARKMRKELSAKKVTLKNYRKVITTIKKEYFRMLASMQEAYDNTHLKQWDKWVNTVSNGLSELNQYKSVTVFIQLEDPH